jgi:uncharacterized protein (DUF779 family)
MIGAACNDVEPLAMPRPEAEVGGWDLSPPAATSASPLWLADDHCAQWINGQLIVADELELLG